MVACQAIGHLPLTSYSGAARPEPSRLQNKRRRRERNKTVVAMQIFNFYSWRERGHGGLARLALISTLLFTPEQPGCTGGTERKCRSNAPTLRYRNGAPTAWTETWRTAVEYL